jgi:hypothetical protein
MAVSVEENVLADLLWVNELSKTTISAQSAEIGTAWWQATEHTGTVVCEVVRSACMSGRVGYRWCWDETHRKMNFAPSFSVAADESSVTEIKYLGVP